MPDPCEPGFASRNAGAEAQCSSPSFQTSRQGHWWPNRSHMHSITSRRLRNGNSCFLGSQLLQITSEERQTNCRVSNHCMYQSLVDAGVLHPDPVFKLAPTFPSDWVSRGRRLTSVYLAGNCPCALRTDSPKVMLWAQGHDRERLPNLVNQRPGRLVSIWTTVKATSVPELPVGQEKASSAATSPFSLFLPHCLLCVSQGPSLIRLTTPLPGNCPRAPKGTKLERGNEEDRQKERTRKKKAYFDNGLYYTTVTMNWAHINQCRSNSESKCCAKKQPTKQNNVFFYITPL